MTYRPKPETANWEPIAGVGPWRDLSDEEFAAVSAEYDAHFPPDQAGSLERWFERVTETKKIKPATGQEG